MATRLRPHSISNAYEKSVEFIDLAGAVGLQGNLTAAASHFREAFREFGSGMSAHLESQVGFEEFVVRISAFEFR